jgi:hypothetical protein
MKKLLLSIAFLFISITTFAQANMMTSVLGIELGSKRQEVKNYLVTKQPQAKVYSQTDISVSYEGIKWGEFETLLTIFQFSDDDRLHTVMIFVDPSSCSKIFRLYDDVVEILTERYYKPNKTYENYSYPYSKSDKYTYGETMVKSGKTSIGSLWSFDSRNTPSDPEDDNNITVVVTQECSVKVTYQDGVIIDEVIAKKKAKESKDY